MDKLDYESINEEQEREFEQHQTVCQDIELRAMRVKIDELVDGYNELKKRLDEILTLYSNSVIERDEEGGDPAPK